MKRFLTLSFFIFNFSFFISSQTTDRGFIHPGGLHTQADFDRVKAQLAAGNTKVKQAYAKLTSAAYAQSSVTTSPTETVVRGGGSGENYMNAARGATMAYQNALRWKISGAKANANAAVRILMAWANTTKAISGDTNYALAAGLYGYQFAQAAELMRDYDGWSHEDFETFRQWMLEVWYPSSLGFMRGRNGTWENSSTWWKAPGHYWSNWGLCNALCVVSIGILCDDVFIYNQGMSYFKYDQVGNYTDPPTMHEVTGHGDADGGQCIYNDGLTEFLGNLVVTHVESGLETEAYGKLGQLNESGRDAGHSAMSLGLAVDLAKIGWNQGDDLFAYMDHRLAAGIEYLAAQTQSVEGLPWTDYMYGTGGYYYSDSRAWLMTEPALGAQMRPYWGTVIGIYEGVKGVKMPFSEGAYEQMGIDEGGQGSTSGGYDHMGYSVLMNTRDEQLCPADQVPTELSPKMEYSGTISASLIPSLAKEKARGLVDGKMLLHNELGGLVNSYATNNNTTVPSGQTLTLMPQLPEGEEDTGKWLWNTGATTRDITVTTDHSFIYRVTYTNKNGIESQLCFPIAVKGDCIPDRLVPTITVDSEVFNDTTAAVLYGKTATLKASSSARYGTWKWTGNKTTEELTTGTLRKPADYTVEYTNQGGAVTTMTFHLDVLAAKPYAYVGDNQAALVEEGTTLVADKYLATRSSLVADAGSTVKLGLTLPTAVRAANVSWDTGATGDVLLIEAIQQSHTYVATFTLAGEEVQMVFNVMVKSAEASVIEPGRYLLRHAATGTYLTAHGQNQLVTFESSDESYQGQWWQLNRSETATPKYSFGSLDDDNELIISTTAKLVVSSLFSFYIDQAVGTDRVAIHTGASASTTKYWDVADDGTVLTAAATTLTAFPFQLISYSDIVGIRPIDNGIMDNWAGVVYDLSGRKIVNSNSLSRELSKGVYIVNGKKVVLKL